MRNETIKIDFKKHFFSAKLTAVGFKEGDSQIVYLPSLRISGYGDTPEEAHEMIKISLKEFSKTLLQLPEHKVLAILDELGWIRNKFFKRQLSNLSETTFDDIKKEFNLPDNTQVQSIPIEV